MAKSAWWVWVQDVKKSCGFAPQSQAAPMWVGFSRTADLGASGTGSSETSVPGMSEELLEQSRAPGGSLEEKLEAVIDVFRSSQRHLESCREALRRQALERRQAEGRERLPAEVEEVISGGTYLDSFLEAYDGQSFLLHSEEIVPCHEYRLGLEVNSGGAYWKGISIQEAGSLRHDVQAVAGASGLEGSMNIISQFGAAQRGAVLAWRWQHVLDAGPYDLPAWLAKALATEGNDPLRKLQAELEAVRRWEHQVQLDTCKYIKANNEVKDIYIREVLRLWPSETDHQGVEVCKKCAWVEGLDATLFTSRNILVQRVPYDDSHGLALHACIARRQVDEKDKDQSPPYRLITTWVWVQASAASAATVEAQAQEARAKMALQTSSASGAAGNGASVVQGLAKPNEACVSRTLSIPYEIRPSSFSGALHGAVQGEAVGATSVPATGSVKPSSTYLVSRPSTAGSLSRPLSLQKAQAVPLPVPVPVASVAMGPAVASVATPSKVWFCAPPGSPQPIGTVNTLGSVLR